MTRLACDPRTKAYAARRTAEGKTKKEIIRCLKRYIARATSQTRSFGYGLDVGASAAPRAAAITSRPHSVISTKRGYPNGLTPRCPRRHAWPLKAGPVLVAARTPLIRASVVTTYLIAA